MLVDNFVDNVDKLWITFLKSYTAIQAKRVPHAPMMQTGIFSGIVCTYTICSHDHNQVIAGSARTETGAQAGIITFGK